MIYKASFFEAFLFIDLLMKRYLIIILFFNILCSDIQRLNSSNRIRYDFTNYDSSTLEVNNFRDEDELIEFIESIYECRDSISSKFFTTSPSGLIENPQFFIFSKNSD